MNAKGHPLLGKWRITSMELWDAEFIDLLGPGYIREVVPIRRTV